MPAVKRRKLAATTTTKHSSLVPAQQKGIQPFGKVTKAATPLSYNVKKERKDDILSILHSVEERPPGYSNIKKRKLVAVQDIVVQERSSPTRTESLPYSNTDAIDSRSSAPASETPPRDLPPSLAYLSPTNTPTKGARGCLETLLLDTSPLPINKSLLSNIPTSSPLSSRPPIKIKCSIDHSSSELPNELLDLINLNSSFLTALSLHYAHHGTLAPADLRILTPSIERAWGKRKVKVEDIRLILALSRDGSTSAHKVSKAKATGVLHLSDYGHGKVCVEVSGITVKSGFLARPLDEKSLNKTFVRNLTLSWKTWLNTSSQPPEPSIFITTLPLAPIILCSSLQKITPLLAKGQQRLKNLKANTITTNKDRLDTFSPAHPQSPDEPRPKATGIRKTSLLERIKAKEQHQSMLPAPPSQDSLDRQSALQRLEEIVPVLTSLTNCSRSSSHVSTPLSFDNGPDTHATGQKISFTLPALVQTLQNSLKNPLSKAEGELCVRLLAEDVAPEWVGLLKMGKVVGVTVHRGQWPGSMEMRRRVAAALLEGGGFGK